MNNKGFTLVEMLAAIVILASIMVISIPSYLDISQNMKDSSKENQIKILIDAVVEYSYKKDIDIIKKENEESTTLFYSVDCIFDKEIFIMNRANSTGQDKIDVYIDPTTNKKLVGGIEVSFNKDTLQLEGKYTTSSDKQSAPIC